jgi:hypothetical protein
MAIGHVLANVYRDTYNYIDELNNSITEHSPLASFLLKFFRVGRCIVDHYAFFLYNQFLIFYVNRKLIYLSRLREEFKCKNKILVYWAFILGIFNYYRTVFTAVIGFFLINQ